MSNPASQSPREGELRVTAWSEGILINRTDGIALNIFQGMAVRTVCSLSERC
jgi:hypothetical protein